MCYTEEIDHNRNMKARFEVVMKKHIETVELEVIGAAEGRKVLCKTNRLVFEASVIFRCFDAQLLEMLVREPPQLQSQPQILQGGQLFPCLHLFQESPLPRQLKGLLLELSTWDRRRIPAA